MTRILLTGLLALSILCAPLLSRAQSSSCEQGLVAAAKIPDDNERTRELRKYLDVGLRAPCVVELLILPDASRATRIMLWNLFKASTANLQQSGSSANGTSGSTNLISKNTTSHILSLASEYGAITESTSGQTTTVNGTLDGIPLALEANTQGLFAECGATLSAESKCLPTKWFNTLGRVSYSLSLDSVPGSQITGTTLGTPQGTTQPASLNTNGNPIRVSQITTKIVLFQPPSTFDNFSKALTNLDKSELSQTGTALQNAQKKLLAYQEGATGYTTWVETTSDYLSKAAPDKVVAAWRATAIQLANILESGSPGNKGPSEDELIGAAVSFASAYSGYAAAERSFFNTKQARRPVLTFEYDVNRPANRPSNSVFRLIYGQSLGKSWTLTANGAFSIFNSAPSSSIPGASSLRDIQAGFEADRNLGSLWILGPATASGAYYFQYQSSPGIVNVNPSQPISGISITGLPANATQVFTQKGSINVAQVKLALGSAKSSWRFPISVTWSNRTELITQPTWRAQIGINYDFDSLFGTGKSSQ
jgi:hypothetical protein